ncbi:type 1 fimbrial protein [Pseudomonas sp. S9]|uniref:type 1 fimbrial protein n=1 Tax=Pseudomonas sp. S9 TaxID=686578 RepID=UPI0002557120|nr:type 1 fimbrial protein [Pseudomonas sp. S9]
MPQHDLYLCKKPKALSAAADKPIRTITFKRKKGITMNNNKYRFATLALLAIFSPATFAETATNAISIYGRVLEPACQVSVDQRAGTRALNVRVTECKSPVNASLKARDSSAHLASASISPLQGMSYTPPSGTPIQAAIITLEYN